MNRREVYTVVFAAAVLIGVFNWVGVARLGQDSLARSKLAVTDRQVVKTSLSAILANQRLINGKLGLPFQPPIGN
jgi:hypothetical protein